MFVLAATFLILGILMRIKGKGTLFAASLCSDEEEREALLRAGKRRNLVGWLLQALAALMVWAIIRFVYWAPGR